MSGLLLLGVLGIWIAIVILLARWLGNLAKSRGLRFDVVFVITALVLLPLPVADELITAPQFSKLCEEGTKLKFDPEKIRGRTVYFVAENPPPSLSIGLLHGYSLHWRYLDAATKEELIASNSYHLKGGFLIRMLGISERDAPLTMRSYCAPKEEASQKSFLNRYDMKYIEQKDIK
ncbi:MAG: hypothetical protein ABI583_07090 [Betaproteobacteria bacterium]